MNEQPVRDDGDYVVYWMTAFRRVRYNFALQRAVEVANNLKKPLLIFDPLRCHYRWASDRFHRFLIDSMLETGAIVSKSKATYCSYVEPKLHHGSGLIEAISKSACAVISDDFPCFFHPAMFRLVSRKIPCRFEVIDSNTIIPMRESERTFTVAHSYRRAMQKVFAAGLPEFPLEVPLQRLKVPKLEKLPSGLSKQHGLRLDSESVEQLKKIDLSDLPIDHTVTTTDDQGGEGEARKVLDRFIGRRLKNYAEDRNEPEKAGSSWLSPYLHFGNISPHEVFLQLTEAEEWSPKKLKAPNGKMTGFWSMSTDAEAFMDQLLTWREIGFNMCVRESNYDRYESLPEWAQETLGEHESDRRENLYTLEEFERAETHDELWNAAQRQLVREGRMHNYLRMLWGKKILHWTPNAREALHIMIELNNKYALDGRNPNSYSGIFWVLGRYDRAWGPERPIFGKIRYMTSDSTRNKYSVKRYIQQYAP